MLLGVRRLGWRSESRTTVHRGNSLPRDTSALVLRDDKGLYVPCRDCKERGERTYNPSRDPQCEVSEKCVRCNGTGAETEIWIGEKAA